VEEPEVESVALVKQLHAKIVLKQAPIEKENVEDEPIEEVRQISDKGKKTPIKIHDPEEGEGKEEERKDDSNNSSEPIRKFKAPTKKPEPEPLPLPVPPVVKRKYTKKATAIQEPKPQEQQQEQEQQQVKPKRAYTKKAAVVVAEENQNQNQKEDVKPKRKYTKKGNDV
jgi:hypothetical protein